MIVFTLDIAPIIGLFLIGVCWLIFEICLKIKNGIFRFKKRKKKNKEE